jgi:hypothetical protein
LIANGYNWDESTSGNKVGKSLAVKNYWYDSTTVGTVGNDQETNNSTGFSGMAPHYRYTNGSFYSDSQQHAFWWAATEYSATKAYVKVLSAGSASLGEYEEFKMSGYAVRLVRDRIPEPVISQPKATLFVPVSESKSFILGTKVLNDAGESAIVVTDFLGARDANNQ